MRDRRGVAGAVLQHVAERTLVADDAAARLHLSGHTVKSHLARAAGRLDTHGSTHTVAMALRNGWIL